MCEGGRPEAASMDAGSVRGAAGLSFAEEEAAGGGGGRAATGTRRPRGWTAIAFIFGLHLAALLNLKHMHLAIFFKVLAPDTVFENLIVFSSALKKFTSFTKKENVCN